MDILFDYLNIVNSTILWKNIINKYILFIDNFESYPTNGNIQKEIDRLLDIIISQSWRKEEEYDIVIPKHKRLISIIDDSYTSKDNICILTAKYNNTLQLLSKLLTFKQLKYTVVSDATKCNKYDYIIPLSIHSIPQKDIDKMDTSKIKLPTVNRYNIIKNDYEKNIIKFINFIKLNIRETKKVRYLLDNQIDRLELFKQAYTQTYIYYK